MVANSKSHSSSSPPRPGAARSKLTSITSLRPLSPVAFSFVSLLQSSYPEFTFRLGARFTFRPPRTIIIESPVDYLSTGSNSPDSNIPSISPSYFLLVLHELAHALCGHSDYRTHIHRLQIESEAWAKAHELINTHPDWSQKYHFSWDNEFVETQLDTYRDWLHQKSLCPHCRLTRFQTSDGNYHCPHCETFIHPN